MDHELAAAQQRPRITSVYQVSLNVPPEPLQELSEPRLGPLVEALFLA